MNTNTKQNNAEQSFKVSRREILTAGGATLVGAALLGSLLAFRLAVRI